MYDKTVWQDSPSTATPINAQRLNKIENGIWENNVISTANQQSIDTLQGEIDTIREGITVGDMSLNDFLNMAYPVGSVYISTAGINPATLFGGEWEQVNGKLLLVGDTGVMDNDIITSHTIWVRILSKG